MERFNHLEGVPSFNPWWRPKKRHKPMRPIRGWGQPKVLKPPSLDSSQQDFQRMKNEASWLTWPSSILNHHLGKLPWIKTILLQVGNFPNREGKMPNGSRTPDSMPTGRYFYEGSELDSVSMVSMTTSKARTVAEAEKGQEQEGIFDHCLSREFRLLKLNDDLSENNLWMWLTDAQRYIRTCSMSTVENEIDRNLSNGFCRVWFRKCQMLGDDVPMALSKIKWTNHQQHCNGLLQRFYAMTQKSNKSIRIFAMKLDMAAGKVQLQSTEALGSTEEVERHQLDYLLQSIHSELQTRVAHLVDGKAANQRPTYGLVEFTVQKEVEIKFDKEKKTKDSASIPKAIIHFHYNHKMTRLPSTPALRMVAPAQEEEQDPGEATPTPSEGSNSGK